jgi:hypothetical protein
VWRKNTIRHYATLWVLNLLAGSAAGFLSIGHLTSDMPANQIEFLHLQGESNGFTFTGPKTALK